MTHVKIAATDHPVMEVIRNRWSPRAFTDQIISDEHLQSVFEAARWAASSGNEQPWKYVYTRKNTPGWDELFECLTDGNKKWVKFATVLMVAITRTTFKRNGRINPHAEHDLGMANAHMFLEAVDLGFYLHPMAGFDPDKIRTTIHLPENEKPVCMIAGGYLGDPHMLDERNEKSENTPRTREPVSSFVTRW